MADNNSGNQNLTKLIVAWQEGDSHALNTLMSLVHDELCVIAKRYLKNERPDHTLQTTALVNEAYLRLADQKDLNMNNRGHFFGVAARVMRQVLIDHARGHHAYKRGGHVENVRLSDIENLSEDKGIELVKLDEGLNALAAFDERKCRIVEMRYFAGLTIEETAMVMKVSPATLKREWAIAKSWLFRYIAEA